MKNSENSFKSIWEFISNVSKVVFRMGKQNPSEQLKTF